MPKNKDDYPADWKDISLSVRKDAENKCEWCGVDNYKPHPITKSKVVLTVAHIDHDTQNNERSNLAALCQRCHLGHDAKQHARTRERNRLKKAGQKMLIPGYYEEVEK